MPVRILRVHSKEADTTAKKTVFERTSSAWVFIHLSALLVADTTRRFFSLYYCTEGRVRVRAGVQEISLVDRQ